MTAPHGTWAAIRAHMAAGERCCDQCARVLDHEQYGDGALTCRSCNADLRPARPSVWVDANGHATGTIAGRNHNHTP